jgi:signal peptidase
LAIIILLLVSLWAYTQNWPPMYVVESNSMQHGDVDQLGLINTGDLVLAQKIDASQVTTYVVGLQSGYSTYGEYGDVILYHANGIVGPAPVIHRAILYLDYDSGNAFTIPALQPLPCGSQSDAVYTLSSTSNGCGWNHITGSLTLHHIGWMSVNVTVDLSGIGHHSGFVTMGDNNINPGNGGEGIPDQPALSTLVDPSWVVGVARGMLPWFGAVKLLLEGQSSEVPTQSWQFMGITLIAIVGGGFAIHYALRREPPEEPEESDDEGDDDDTGPPPSRWRSLRLFRGRGVSPEGDDEDADEPGAKPRLGASSSRGGRPHPSVKRGHASRVAAPKDADPEDPDL